MTTCLLASRYFAKRARSAGQRACLARVHLVADLAPREPERLDDRELLVLGVGGLEVEHATPFRVALDPVRVGRLDLQIADLLGGIVVLWQRHPDAEPLSAFWHLDLDLVAELERRLPQWLGDGDGRVEEKRNQREHDGEQHGGGPPHRIVTKSPDAALGIGVAQIGMDDQAPRPI